MRKTRGRKRLEGSFQNFRNFIAEMNMGEVKFRDNPFTWANNHANEGFIQERLDKFFGSMQWMLRWDSAKVQHLAKQTSDHLLLVLDTQPNRQSSRSRIIFYSRWANMNGVEDLVKEAWGTSVQGSRMFRVQQKLKLCKIRFLEWRKTHNNNSRAEIDRIQREMVAMQKQEGSRDWTR